ncbi:hypothetical protein [Amycolatopsis azurea]|nr:hypothetical protein [Amycolatopsis azurea]
MSDKRKPGRPATGQTPARSIKMPDERWKNLGKAAERAGSDRSKVLNDFAAWYTDEEDAELPVRPE